MDNEIAKQSQKILQKQGLKFKLNTKVTAGEVHDAGVKVSVEASKGCKEETVSHFELSIQETILINIARRRCRSRSHWPSPIHRRSWSGQHQPRD